MRTWPRIFVRTVRSSFLGENAVKSAPEERCPGLDSVQEIEAASHVRIDSNSAPEIRRRAS